MHQGPGLEHFVKQATGNKQQVLKDADNTPCASSRRKSRSRAAVSKFGFKTLK
jgi:hypothetical protein